MAADPLLPIRILAIIALIAVVWTFIHVLLHLRSARRTISRDDLLPPEMGARENMLLIVCAIPIIVVSLLVFLIVKT